MDRAAERSWSNVKQTKDGKRSNLGGALLDKSAMLFSLARLNEACIRRDHNEDDRESNIIGHDDIK